MGKSGGWFILDSRKQRCFLQPGAGVLMRFDAQLGCLSSISAALGFMGGTEEQAMNLLTLAS